MSFLRPKFLLLAVTVIALGSQARASWAGPDDADYSVESETMDYTVHHDGTYKVRHERTVKILKESARSTMGIARHFYDPDAETFKVLEAQTINGKDTLPVQHQFIEDKPIASDLDGFDDRNQVSVVFPDVKVGSEIHEVDVKTVNKLGVKDLFSLRFYFGLMELLKARTITIHSEAPLLIQTNDPIGRLAIEQDAAHENFKITLKEPIFNKVMHEKNSVINEKDKTWIVVSNFNSFKDVFKGMAKKYESIVSSPLPTAFQDIVAQAKNEKTTIEKINSVTSQLAAMVRYVGDWREVKGAYEPHPLATIASTKFGDCKDFSVSTAAMLRALGLKAQVIILERGKLPTPWPDLPLMSALNHAMVKAEDQGQIYWVDPTNFQSFSQGIFEDVINRSAVVLDPENIRVEHIEAAHPADSLVKTDMVMNFYKDGDVALSGSMYLQGRAAVPVTGASLFATQEELSYQLATSFFPDQNLKQYKVDGLELTSRIVKDIKFDINLTAKNTSLKTTAGFALRVPDAGIVSVFSDVDLRTRVSDLVLDTPSTLDLIYKLDHVNVIGNRLKGCRLKSPWLDASLALQKSGNTALIHDTFSTKTEVIPIEALKTTQFETFQKQFRDCFENTAVVYLPTGNPPKIRALSSAN